MNRIKIIKSGTKQFSMVQKSSEQPEIEKTKTIRTNSANVVADWINEWREKKQKDAERNKTALLNFESSADFRTC